MTNERNKTLMALQMAIQMEADGREYYSKISQESCSELGRKLLTSLAAEEDTHRQKFEEIYRAISAKRAWPVTDFKPDRGERLRTIFAEATEEVGLKAKIPATELDAIQIAMDMENKSHDFYRSQGEDAGHGAEMDFYEALAAEERQHLLVLLDYYEYLKNPAGWLVKKEHPSLDGG